MATKTADKKGGEATEAPQTDSPLLDLSDAAVKRMIKLAKKRGFVTHEELNEVQGGGIAFQWAIKMGELISHAITIYEASSKIEFEPSSYGSVDAGGYNPMGDYTNGICNR